MDKREEKKKVIIEKAQKIFLEKGLLNIVMDDIAAAVGLTRRSLYRYFETKEDMAYETAILLLNEWNAYHKKVYSQLSGNGIYQLEDFLNQLINYIALIIYFYNLAFITVVQFFAPLPGPSMIIAVK